ncbi:hypothetical protein [Desulfofundulus thermosubterraneus]|uniref:Phospholipase_D-nuclease N-terminal n=1 Tax=Desulfofundulus thermosubterraneus DSM 16057 TaxID=1121432 RepID=A0A1M6LK77_9FIRM|nr:hypothetical protein [Desulfofundulus thermosubterraneus]SHJ71580.1 hypothetical protein SAMN02745219_03169 [Desulfofundulus thermosubterraneus DSM 16057]
MSPKVALVITWLLLGLMVSNGLWVAWDARRRGKPLGEVIAWGLFSTAFFGIGLALYLMWGRHLPSENNDRKS